jgi:hypothetical protein
LSQFLAAEGALLTARQRQWVLNVREQLLQLEEVLSKTNPS